MADLYTNGLTVSGSIAFFESFVEILTVDGDSASPVSLIYTDSGNINLEVELDTRAVTLQAFTGDDVITTSQGNDSILGNDGNDVVIAADGDDTLVGGTGNDQLSGGVGFDVFELTGINDGTDIFSGGDDTDTLRLTGAQVSLTRLVLNAAASVEVIDFATNALTGTLGNDLFDLTGVTSFIAGGIVDMAEGNDSYQGAVTGDDVLGGLGNDTLSGNSGDDTLTGGAGNDSLTGGADNDLFQIGSADAGNDTFAGGAGTDRLVLDVAPTAGIVRLVLDAAASVEEIDLNGFALTGTAGNDFYNLGGVLTYAAGNVIDLLDGNDTFSGAQAADDVTGGTGNDSLSGAAGNDLLTGGDGNDTMDGGTGDDVMTGGAQNDTYVVDSAGDVTTEVDGGGTDRVLVGALGSFTLAGAIENAQATGATALALTGNALGNDLTGTSANDTLDGAAGDDTLRGGAGDDSFVIDTLTDVVIEDANKGSDTVLTALASLTLGGNLENLTGTATTGQTLTGNAADNTIQAGNGNDRLDGGTGHDTMLGGLGDDAFVVDNASDVISETATGGSDWVETSLKSYSLALNVEDLLGTSATGQNLKGNDLANWIETGAGKDTIDGGLGADTMRGGAGDDLYLVQDSGDKVSELAGGGTDTVKTDLVKYTLGSEVENLTSTLQTGATLNGNLGANGIKANAGDDILDGRDGKDTLTGGGGADTFVFKTALGSGNVDTITDFNAKDTMKLENTGAGMFEILPKGVLATDAFKVIGPTGSAVDSDDRILYNQTTGALFYDADGSGTGAKVQFATLTNGVTLTAADFLIF